MFPREVLVLQNSILEMKRDTEQEVLSFRENNSGIQSHFTMVSLETEVAV